MRLRRGMIGRVSALCAVGLVLLFLALGTGCTDRKAVSSEEVVEDSLAADSAEVDTVADIVEDAPISKAVDELFDDFFFNFAGNRHMQFNRIQFPLVTDAGGQKRYVEKQQWHMDHFFMGEGYYTIILDNEDQMELAKDTTVSRVVVEKILFKEELVKQYDFGRIDGKWMLTAIHRQPLDENVNASFLRFYEHFSSDSLYQVENLDNFVIYTAPDPDDDFGEITGSILPEQWPMFKPELIPSGDIYNVIYGQKYADPNQKVLTVRGVANGLEISMVFRKKEGNWKLTMFK